MRNSAYIKTSDEGAQYVDIYSEYGVSFMKGSYLKLLNYSKAKEYVQNDSRLENGVQILATADYAKVMARTISLNIFMEAGSRYEFVNRYEAFTKLLNHGVFFLKIPSSYRAYKLVYSDIQPSQDFNGKYGIFALSLIEPNPEDRVHYDSNGNEISEE